MFLILFIFYHLGCGSFKTVALGGYSDTHLPWAVCIYYILVVPLRQCTDILKKYQCNIMIAPSSLGIYLLIPHTNTIYLTDTALRFRIISFMVRETFLAITLRYITNINIIILRLMTTNLNRNIGWGQMFSLSRKLLKIAKTNSMIMS